MGMTAVLPGSIQAVKNSGSSHSASKRDDTGAAAGKGTLPAFKSVSHVLFDLDGLLIDTEKFYAHAAERVASRYGKKFTWELNRRVLGTPDACAARTIVETLGLPLTPDGFLEAVDQMSQEVYHSAQLMPGAERLLRHLHAHGIPMAVATSSTPASFALKMTQHKDIVALFHHVVCSGGDPRVKHGKPHPDIFLVAASKFLETPPSEKVLVFEDSPMGVTAALSAGMQVVMVPDPRIDEEIRRRATLCIVSLTEFKPEVFGLPSFNTSPQKS
ncbi:pseudouridine-5'-phosphatase-like [Dermacentor andersoni]|uniref:pseudouridine-5'-phosphatase-like n=1 Tax=Dermacentor andersoni TaxID=34620 RepID=UPI00241769EC|nr:pseudouridine-5'-phosphatase-like [Dermacentor andersoni]